MARDKNQILMFSDADLSLIKNTFAGDEGEELLYLIRNALLQFPLTDTEKKRLKGIMNDEVYRVVKKKILPSVDPDAPFGQLADLWQSLTNDLKVKGVEEMAPLFEAKQLEIDYLTQQFEYLKDVEKEFKPVIILDQFTDMRNDQAVLWFIKTTARNYILGYVDSFLIQLKFLAGQKTESVEETKKRLIRDSSK